MISGFILARPTRLELATSRVTGECSNQIELRPHATVKLNQYTQFALFRNKLSQKDRDP